MAYHGKHIIDPKTGLCEICDRGAIHDFKKGKRTGKQFLYSNHDGKFMYRPSDDSHDQRYSEPTPRRTARQTLPAIQPPRSRRDNYPPSSLQAKPTPRRAMTPPDDRLYDRSYRSAVFYHVDSQGQMYPQRDVPPPPQPKRIVVQAAPPRANHRGPIQTQTPSPRLVEPQYVKPRRDNNSDSEVPYRQNRGQSNGYHHRPSDLAEMYYIEGNSPRDPRQYRSYENLTPSPKVYRQPEENRRNHRLDPINREAERPVERKVYRKLPANSTETPPKDLYSSDGNHYRKVRKIETFDSPPPRRTNHRSSPLASDTFDRRIPSNHNATMYYLQRVNGYN